jgi:negative regulator of sigma E activity
VSLSETELIYLMAYVDGQVDDDELPEVTALLARSEEARQIVAQHAALGDWVRQSADRAAAAAGADRIAGKVAAEIDKLGGGKVIGLERERAKAALNRQRVKEFGALGAVAAMAAAFLLLPSTGPAPVAKATATATSHASPRVGPSASPPASSVALAKEPDAHEGIVASAAEDPNGDAPAIDIQSVESPSHPFSIFYMPAVPSAAGLKAQSSSVVVWITE